MKKILLSFLFVAAGISCWADEYYLVGDATPCGWATGDARKPMQMTETATSGVYEWTGLLKHGGDAAGNGFYICNSLSGWSALYPSETFPISDTGECAFQKEQEFKWNPTNADWQFYTITLNTNEGKVSWVAGDAWITPDADGFYNIGTAKDLYLFSLVAIGNRSVKAKLTADIDYTEYPKGFIGLNSNRYAGIFDGQEHTVTIDIKNNTTCTGLFGVIDGATIKNLVVEGNCESSAKLIGGLGGVSYGNCTIENIVVKTAVKFTGTGDATCGGILGDMEAASTVKNCAFYGSFESEKGSNIRALASWCSNNPQFTNCIIAPAEINANGYDTKNLANGGYTTNNCVKVAADDATLASGELCLMLKNGWYQTIGTDKYPVPFKTHGIVKQISEAGYATLYVADTDVEIPAGITANAGVLEGNWLTLNAIDGKIAAGEPVILKGTAGIYSFVPTTGATKAAANDLKGAAEEIDATGKYVLAQPENEKVGFYLANGGKIAAGKAYLELPAAGVKAFFFAEEETGIANVNVKDNQTPVYNLAGQRINKLQKGINIVGGKKILK